MSRELKDAKDAEHPQRDERSANRLVRHEHRNVEGEDGDDINNGEHTSRVQATVRCGEQTKHVLNGEHDHARRFDAEKEVGVFPSACLARTVHRFDDGADDADRDEKTRHVVESLGDQVGLRVFEPQPQFLTRCSWNSFIIVIIVERIGTNVTIFSIACEIEVGQPLIQLLLPVVELVPTTVRQESHLDSEEFQLLLKTSGTLVAWEVQLSRAVIVQDEPEQFRVPVKVVLLHGFVVKELTLAASQ